MSSVNLPKFEIQFNQLPSRGLGYPENAKIYYRGYTTGELSKIAAVRNDSITADFIIRNALEGIETENMPKTDLSYIDVLALGLRRRVSSEGEVKFQLPFKCEECGKIDYVIFDQSDIKFNTIPETVKVDDQDMPVKLPIKVSIKEKELHFWYPTVGNMLDVLSKKGVEKITATKAMCVRNVEFREAYDLIYNLNDVSDIDDIEVLEIVDRAIYHDIAPFVSVCKNKIESEDGQLVQCGHTNEVSADSKELLIRPFRESKASVANKIRFGN